VTGGSAQTKQSLQQGSQQGELPLQESQETPAKQPSITPSTPTEQLKLSDTQPSWSERLTFRTILASLFAILSVALLGIWLIRLRASRRKRAELTQKLERVSQLSELYDLARGELLNYLLTQLPQREWRSRILKLSQLEERLKLLLESPLRPEAFELSRIIDELEGMLYGATGREVSAAELARWQEQLKKLI
jgi:hypothetical protein